MLSREDAQSWSNVRFWLKADSNGTGGYCPANDFLDSGTQLDSIPATTRGASRANDGGLGLAPEKQEKFLALPLATLEKGKLYNE